MRAEIPNDRSNFERLVRYSLTYARDGRRPPPTRPGAARPLRGPPQQEVVAAARASCSPSAATTRPRCRTSPRRPGLAAGGLYHYIGSKEQLLIAICDELLDAAARAGARDRRRDEPPRPSSCATLLRAWLAHIESPPRPHARLRAGAPRDRARARSGATCAASARRSSRSSTTCSRAAKRDGAMAFERPRPGAARAARDGQLHRAVAAARAAASPPRRSPTAGATSSSLRAVSGVAVRRNLDPGRGPIEVSTSASAPLDGAQCRRGTLQRPWQSTGSPLSSSDPLR